MLYRVRALGQGSLAACWLASDALDACCDLTGCVKPRDLAAGRIIMEEAGAEVEYLNRRIIDHVEDGLRVRARPC